MSPALLAVEVPSEPREVKAYKCRFCSFISQIRSEAERHCICSRCKRTPLQRIKATAGQRAVLTRGFLTSCKCTLPERIAYSRDRIARLRNAIDDEERDLAELVAELTADVLADLVPS